MTFTLVIRKRIYEREEMEPRGVVVEGRLQVPFQPPFDKPFEMCLGDDWFEKVEVLCYDHTDQTFRAEAVLDFHFYGADELAERIALYVKDGWKVVDWYDEKKTRALLMDNMVKV